MAVDREKNIPLYRQIYQEIKTRIISKRYKCGELLPSERELCEQYNVDRITVRKSLELLVEEGLVEKKAGLGTQVREFPDSILKESYSPTILFMLPKSPHQMDRITEPFNVSLFYTIEKECHKNGFDLIYKTLGDEDDFSSLISRRTYSGYFFISEINEKHLATSKRLGLPAVLVNNSSPGFTSIITDNERGGYIATNHLLELGHKKISFITGFPEHPISNARFNGYIKALNNANLDWHDQSIATGDWTFDGGYIGMKEILKKTKKYPTAVFAVNDVSAFGAIEAIRENGLSVPEDISVIGFDNIEQCDYVRPRLTTLAVKIDMMTRMACQFLFQIIKSKKDDELVITVPTNLIIRESTRKINNSSS